MAAAGEERYESSGSESEHDEPELNEAEEREENPWPYLKAMFEFTGHGPCGPYTQLNSTVPIIRQFLDDTVDLRPNLCLSRRSRAALTAAIYLSVTRGWPKDIEVLLVTKAVVGILGRTIRLPNPDQLEDIAAGFSRLGRSPALLTVVGAIDGCHAIYDHQWRFIDLFVGFPGSVHDAHVLWNSPEGCCILGDGGYSCLGAPICLLTPYREPVANPVQARFNTIHGKARNIVKRTFGMVKARWRSIFLRALEVKPAFASEVVIC
ncbi:putative nuclease HARBI1 isoform X1 [Xyrichtys novacula]|uniref:Nuclease HARBI1 isoform X1 n=1 Tax=Xyrichtys novacula TaxID=13765 RepID=A0AAV1FAA8_XYRNO|nr:putative nuclease HARBI1 isoform X1 [Xyrichtys novacula]